MEQDNSKKSLLDQIRSYAFSVNDLSLYLDTHPCDQKALNAHKEYSEKLINLKNIYKAKYGSLTIYNPTDDWDEWVNKPWPWERGGI